MVRREKVVTTGTEMAPEPHRGRGAHTHTFKWLLDAETHHQECTGWVYLMLAPKQMRFIRIPPCKTFTPCVGVDLTDTFKIG